MLERTSKPLNERNLPKEVIQNAFNLMYDRLEERQKLAEQALLEKQAKQVQDNGPEQQVSD